MSASFAPGDVVVCVVVGLIETECCIHDGTETAPLRHVGRVARIVPIFHDCDCLQVDLEDGFSGYTGRFRKIDAPDTEIAARIRACKPERVPC